MVSGEQVSKFSVFTFIIHLWFIKLRKSVFRFLCPPETGWTRSVATEGVDGPVPLGER